MQQSRWLITGAAGRIGVALRRHLAKQGVALRSVDLAKPLPVTENDEAMTADLRDFPTMMRAAEGCDGVIHLGGISDEADFHDLAEANIVGSYHVLESARRAGIHRVIFASSNRVTGMYPAGTMVDPSMPVRPDGFYGVSKVAGEALCRLYADKFQLHTVTVRIGSYEDLPRTQRDLRTWLSPGDALRAFDTAMASSQPGAVFYAVSENTGRWWSSSEGEQLGFHPEDNAQDNAGFPVEPYPPTEAQAGPYADAEFSTNRMNQ